jgi:hypothetical protein
VFLKQGVGIANKAEPPAVSYSVPRPLRLPFALSQCTILTARPRERGDTQAGRGQCGHGGASGERFGGGDGVIESGLLDAMKARVGGFPLLTSAVVAKGVCFCKLILRVGEC